MDHTRETTQERRVICQIDRGYSRDNDIGKVRAYFEILPNNDVIPINAAGYSHFCDTERVFVTAKYSEIQERFEDRLFEVICIPSTFEVRDGDCKYITRMPSCSELRNLTICQIFDTTMPTATDPVAVLDSKPITRTILIRENGNVSGPFEYTHQSPEDHSDTSNNILYRMSLKAQSTPFLPSMPPFHIGKLTTAQCASSMFEKPGEPTLLCNIKRTFERAVFEDFISDDQILSIYGGKIAQNAEIRMFNKMMITQIRKSFAHNNDQKRFPERIRRLFSALETAHSWQGERQDLIDSFLATKSGKALVSNYISTNRDEFFKGEKQTYLTQLEKDNQFQRNELTELETKKSILVSEIQKLQREHEKLELDEHLEVATVTRAQKEMIDAQMVEKRQEIEQLNASLKDLNHKYQDLNTLEKYNAKVAYLKERIREEQTEQIQLGKEVERVRSELKEENETLTKRLLALKPSVDALSGIAPRKKSKTICYGVDVRQKSEVPSEDIRDELIKSTLQSLSKLGRKLSYNATTNLLCTIAQSQFTLFSGRPGTGKTSLAKLLGHSLGLQNRLLNIPVARGWTSSKDVLGFYNALSGSFTPAATGLYELMTQLDSEIKQDEDSAPAIVLLDEFNLSQPEHYFSPFLEMADPESKRTIITSDLDKPYLSVPEHLRFLGTINHDASVQPLTPRMLDRAAIISFDEVEMDYDLSLSQAIRIEDIEDIVPLSGKQFLQAFTPQSLELPQDIERVLKGIIDVLRDTRSEFGHPITISFRKIKAIRAYHNVTASMYIDSRFTALDYSISQHIIPLLNGYGQPFGRRLEQLQLTIPDEMIISHTMLKRLIDNGAQNIHTYGFNL
ncbi:AAA family ATPase [Photobacterium phosphoreum]|uniref:AAA family ATPase n=1 Tax=Photobacterium phosphoreum TaxID=659 RepID=UPI0039AEE33F